MKFIAGTPIGSHGLLGGSIPLWCIGLLELEVDTFLGQKVKHFIFEAAKGCLCEMSHVRWWGQCHSNLSHEVGEWLATELQLSTTCSKIQLAFLNLGRTEWR